jgi:hypothetical protein
MRIRFCSKKRMAIDGALVLHAIDSPSKEFRKIICAIA